MLQPYLLTFCPQSVGSGNFLVTFSGVPAGEFALRLKGEETNSTSRSMPISFQRQASTQIKTSSISVTVSTIPTIFTSQWSRTLLIVWQLLTVVRNRYQYGRSWKPAWLPSRLSAPSVNQHPSMLHAALEKPFNFMTLSFCLTFPPRLHPFFQAQADKTNVEPGSTISILFTVATTSNGVNSFATQMFKVRANNDQNYTSTSPSTVTTAAAGSGRKANGTVTLTVPASAASGTDVTLTIEVENAAATDINYSVLRFSVASKVRDKDKEAVWRIMFKNHMFNVSFNLPPIWLSFFNHLRVLAVLYS